MTTPNPPSAEEMQILLKDISWRPNEESWQSDSNAVLNGKPAHIRDEHDCIIAILPQDDYFRNNRICKLIVRMYNSFPKVLSYIHTLEAEHKRMRDELECIAAGGVEHEDGRQALFEEDDCENVARVTISSLTIK